MTDSPAFDLFISYAEADAAWVEGYLCDALTTAGARVHSEAAFALGAPLLAEFERAVANSRRTLLVLSPAYLTDDFGRFGELLAQTYGLETATWPVVPLLLEPVTLPPRLAILTPLDATDPADWPAAIARLCDELHRPVPTEDDAVKPDCPYPGMAPYKEADHGRFFGREDDIQALLECLRLHPFLAVLGPSGSGKSSLVFAGLLPALRTSGLFGEGAWQERSLRPGSTPLAALAGALGGDPADPTAAVAGALAAAPDAQRLLVVVDQFEESFTLADRAEAARFQEALAGLTATPGCFVVLTARADFYEDLMASPLWPHIQAHRVEVLPLDEAGLRQAIVTPAEQVGVYVEAALVERLVADAAGEPGVLPLVQETLVLLWERLERRFLPLRAYEALVLPRRAYGGAPSPDRTGLQVAIARRADAGLAELLEPRQAIARRIFLRLVQFGEGRADTRRQQPVAGLRAAEDDPADFEATLLHLADRRLLTLSGDERSERRADIAHEALIGAWPRLQEWIAERREAEQTRRRLEGKAEEWIRLGRGRGGLLDEAELPEAERWMASGDAIDLGFAAALPELVAASKAALADARQRELQQLQELADEQRRRAEENARGARRLRRRFAVATGFAALALMAALLAFYFFDRAGADRDRALAEADARATAEVNALAAAGIAEAEAAAAATAEVQAQANADLAATRAVEAAAAASTAEAERNRAETEVAVRSTAEGQALAAQSAAEWQTNVSRVRALAARAPREHARFQDDRAALLARQAYLLDAQSGGFVRDQVDDALRSTLGGPTFSHVLSHTLRSPDSPVDPGYNLRGRNSAVRSVVFSPDGWLLASAGDDGIIRLWDLRQPGAIPTALTGQKSGIWTLAFSPDGHTLASADGSTVRLWDVGRSDMAPTVLSADEPVASVAFGPDGAQLVTGSHDGSVRVWDMGRLDQPPMVVRSDSEDSARSLAFSPDGQTLAVAGWAGVVQLWDVRNWGNLPTDLPIAGATNASVAFSPDGETLAVGYGATLELRVVGDLRRVSRVLVSTVGMIGPLAFSPDGLSLAASSYYGIVELWDLRSANAGPTILHGHEANIGAIAFGQGGRLLASASDDGTIRVWDLAPAPASPREFDGPSSAYAVDLGPDNRLAVGYGDGSVSVRHLSDPQATPIVFRDERHDDMVVAVAFSPDAQWLASADGWGLTVRLWDLRQPQAPPLEIPADEAFVFDVAFSPDGDLLATTGSEGVVRVWDLRQPDSALHVLEPQSHIDNPIGLTSVAFGPDGQRLAASGSDGQVHLWDLRTPEAPPVVFGGHADRVNAVAFSPDGFLLASGGSDGALLLWDLRQPAPTPTSLIGHELGIDALAFNPDGSTLASAGLDKTVRLWNLQQRGYPPVLLTGFDQPIESLAFSPDGEHLATAANTATLWLVNTRALAERVCDVVWRNLTLAEWQRFVSEDVPYQSTCPNLPPGAGAPGAATPVAISVQLEPA